MERVVAKSMQFWGQAVGDRHTSWRMTKITSKYLSNGLQILAVAVLYFRW